MALKTQKQIYESLLDKIGKLVLEAEEELKGVTKMENKTFIWDGRIAVSRRNSKMINFRAEKELAEKLGKYRNVSEFVRDAVEKEIEEDEKLQRWVKEFGLE